MELYKLKWNQTKQYVTAAHQKSLNSKWFWAWHRNKEIRTWWILIFRLPVHQDVKHPEKATSAVHINLLFFDVLSYTNSSQINIHTELEKLQYFTTLQRVRDSFFFFYQHCSCAQFLHASFATKILVNEQWITRHFSLYNQEWSVFLGLFSFLMYLNFHNACLLL